jgi:hypothetical protein
MILYYAVGGGLGHLTRARSLLHTLRRGRPATIVTASRFAEILEPETAIMPVPMELAEDRDRFRAWMANAIRGAAPEEIFIDTFPAGILGELCDIAFPSATRLNHVARLLRWGEYLPLITGDLPDYATTFRVEPLTGAHEEYIAAGSREIIDTPLVDPPDGRDPRELLRVALPEWNQDRPLWLVIHSEPVAELLELIDYGREMAAMEGIDPLIAVVTPFPVAGLPVGIPQMQVSPAALLLPLAARIITGCGFNAMRQTETHRERHHFIPFSRRYDDQFLRGARRRATSPRTAP